MSPVSDGDGKSVSDLVREHLWYDLHLGIALKRGYVNHTAAAQWLLNLHDWDVSKSRVRRVLIGYEGHDLFDITEGRRCLAQAEWGGTGGLCLLVITEARIPESATTKLENLGPPADHFVQIPGRKSVYVTVEGRHADGATKILQKELGDAPRKEHPVATAWIDLGQGGHEPLLASTSLIGMLGRYGIDVRTLHLAGGDLIFVVPEQDWVRTQKVIQATVKAASADEG